MNRSEALQRELAALSSRLDALERQMKQVRTCTDSEFRRHVHAVSPWPLQQVYGFTLVLKPQFWLDTLKVTADELANATYWGDRFPLHTSRVSIERWRSHRQIRLYGDPSNPCPTREFLLRDPVDLVDQVVHLWRINFGPLLDERWLELYLEDDSIRLGAVGGEYGHGFRHGTGGPFHGPTGAGIFVDVPLWRSPTELEKFKAPPEDDEPDSGGELYYTHTDDAVGVTWHLYVEDLRSLHESEIAGEYSDPFDE